MGDSPALAPASTSDPLAELRHDLCTPINQILGYSELLEEEVAQEHPQFVDDLHRIQQAATTMLSLVRGRITAEGLGAVIDASPGAAAMAEVATDLPGTAAPSSGKAEPLVCHPERLGRILAVDDDALNLDLLAQRLSRQGHVVSTASDGLEALEKARQQPLDLVLLDVMMPHLDGYCTLAAFKADEQLRHIPVIMISALDELSSVVRCIEAGAEDYLPKPFIATLLRARIGACLEKKALRDQELQLYHNLVTSQQRLARELEQADRFVGSLPVEVRQDPQLAPLLAAFERMSGAVSRRETELRATIQELEIKISRQALSRQVGSIVTDPSFFTLAERARAMRARRYDRGAAA
jgi:sigma-B regulation protein RsbU (phosphoserine phosphatase)